jgi:hypothetical protein
MPFPTHGDKSVPKLVPIKRDKPDNWEACVQYMLEESEHVLVKKRRRKNGTDDTKPVGFRAEPGDMELISWLMESMGAKYNRAHFSDIVQRAWVFFKVGTEDMEGFTPSDLYRNSLEAERDDRLLENLNSFMKKTERLAKVDKATAEKRTNERILYEKREAFQNVLKRFRDDGYIAPEDDK